MMTTSFPKQVCGTAEIILIITAGAFPPDFLPRAKIMFKLFFRIFAHLYYAHFLELRHLGLEAHINTCFKHFYHFIREFNLVEEQEMLPLNHLIKNLSD